LIKWYTDKLIAAGGLLTVEIPSDLAGGYYLVRPEILALHQANVGDPQFYTGCAQVFLDSTETCAPSDTVSIPGYVKAGDASVSYDIWTTPLVLPYPIPGPAVYEDSESATTNVKLAVSAEKQTEGLEPAGCILTVGNWCGIELDAYSTETGCWNVSILKTKRRVLLMI
jgi:hypothetical protein